MPQDLAMLAYACGLDTRRGMPVGNMTWGPLPWIVRRYRPDASGEFVGARAFVPLDDGALVVQGQTDDPVECPVHTYDTWHEAAWAVLTWEWAA